MLAHKIALDPTAEQADYFSRAAGTARFAWNWALAHWQEAYNTGQRPSGAILKKQFNKVKYIDYPWLHDAHRDTHAQPFYNLHKAFANFFKKRAAYPQFKKKGIHDSFYVANDVFKIGGKYVRLPKVGWVKLREELRFDGKIMGATVSREADRWFIAIQVESDFRKSRKADSIVGVDLGISHLATLSTGEQIDGPRPLKKALGRLKRLSRQLSRKQKGSSNRQNAKLKVARLHYRIKNIRQDALHKLTTRLCHENQVVVIEDLNVKGMLRNHRLARQISDMGFGEFRRQLEYKALIYDARIIIADRWFPSSKTCNSCGSIHHDFELSSGRLFMCDCGAVIDRDWNAALNLRTLGLRGIACGQEGSGLEVPLGETSLVEAGTSLLVGG